jgi:branched-chain amino acid transport system permease protein
VNPLRSRYLWIILISIALIGLLPIALNSPTMREELFLILMLVVLAVSVNIIMGYTGYVSFGHMVFFGLGGYLAFYLIQTFQVPLVVAAIVGGLFASAFAALLGIPILRLRGAYFALATIGVLEAVRAFFNNFDLFGGSVGMFFNFSVYDAYGGAANALWFTYDILIVVTLLTIVVSLWVKKSKFGLGLLAIREDQDAALVLGVDTSRYKVLAFVVSAFFPGVVGALFFFKNGIIEPNIAFDLLRSIEVLVMVMLGGYGTVIGPIIGAALYELLRSTLITAPPLDLGFIKIDFGGLHLAITGFLLLLIVLFVPAGVVGLLRRRVPRLGRYLE